MQIIFLHLITILTLGANHFLSSTITLSINQLRSKLDMHRSPRPQLEAQSVIDRVYYDYLKFNNQIYVVSASLEDL